MLFFIIIIETERHKGSSTFSVTFLPYGDKAYNRTTSTPPDIHFHLSLSAQLPLDTLLQLHISKSIK